MFIHGSARIEGFNHGSVTACSISAPLNPSVTLTNISKLTWINLRRFSSDGWQKWIFFLERSVT